MDNSKKVALVTGANKGIGFEIAKKLSKAGCTVILGARNEKLGVEASRKLNAEAGNGKSEYVNLDLLKPETIEQAAAWIKDKYGKLDILVNNAGIVNRGDGTPSKALIDAVESTMRTNFMGPLRMVQAMLPLLEKSEGASVVNVSSGLGSLAGNSDRNSPYADVKIMGYSASKAALNMMTVQLAYELRDTNIKVNSVCPGYCATDLNDHRGVETAESGSIEAVRLALLGAAAPSGQYLNKEGALPW
ncbi:MAG: SDR family oxidoreductase [Candidatus Obscuribacterales bacterium]|nr:SDR family oxidoreductase [Candidatus Obscuribacterales bacterium]